MKKASRRPTRSEQVAGGRTQRKGYHYVDSGLPSVWLLNGYRVVKTPYGEAVTIADVEGLHRVIAEGLVTRKPHLSGREFRFIRKELGLSQARLGELLGVQDQTVALWEKRSRLPKQVDRFIRYVYQNERDSSSRVAEVIERLKQIDTHAASKILVQHDADGWMPKAA